MTTGSPSKFTAEMEVRIRSQERLIEKVKQWWRNAHLEFNSNGQAEGVQHQRCHSKLVTSNRSLQYLPAHCVISCLPTTRRQWHPTPVLWTEQLHLHFSLSCIGEEMATHSSVLAWRIPGTGEPGGLPSMGSQRVGHDWSDLAAAAAHWFWGFCISSQDPKISQIPISLTLVFWVHSPAHFFCSQNNNLHFGYSDPRTPRKKVNVAKEQRSMLKIILKNRVEKGRPTPAYLQRPTSTSETNMVNLPLIPASFPLF